MGFEGNRMPADQDRNPTEIPEEPKIPLLLCLLGSAFFSNVSAQGAKETRYLAFQIFTYGPNPIIATMGEGTNPQPARFPDKAVLRDYIGDIKRRIGAVGDPQTRLAVMLGHLSFDHSDADVTKFIELGFDLALETDVAVGFHIDDSMFWGGRKDLWSDPNNVEASDWDGTPCTGRILNWGKKPSVAPPQMCFNSKVIEREVQQRATLIGKAIQAGVNRLQQVKRPELFAGVIAGSETMIGQDFKTGKYLGYRALLNRGFTREHPPQDMDLEREKVVQEFIELWSKGLAAAGVSPQKIYSHTAFLSRRAFGGDDKEITYMRRNGDLTYSQHSHYAPPWVAFGESHRPGFSTYPQAGLFDDIYEQIGKHNQVGWASCEGTNMQPESGPGQTGMNMETYLAKMFNHGATLVTIFSWGIGGEANKNMGFRVVTEGEEALQAYRKFLKGDPLIEGTTVASLTERLPAKIHKIQAELPAWMEKTGNKDGAALMQRMREQLKAKNFEEVEKTADAILEMMGASAQPSTQNSENKPQQSPPSGAFPTDSEKRLTEKLGRVKAGVRKLVASGGDPSDVFRTVQEKFKPLMDSGKVVEAEAELDRLLEQLNKDSKSTEPSISPTQTVPTQTAPTQATQDITEEVREKLAHNIGCSFLLYRTKVLGELKVTKEQKEKLDQRLQTLLPEATQILQKSNGERGKYNQKTHEEMAAVLKEILNEGQRTRLHQLELQKDLLFGPTWNMKELQITDAQQKQFMAPTQEAQKKTMALMEEIHKGANPEAIRPKAFQIRLDLEVQLEALLTDAQKKQWKEMLGRPVDPGVIYGGL
jgi:hypothetical protein